MNDTGVTEVKAAIRAASDRFEENFRRGDAQALVADYYVEEPIMSAPDAPLQRGRNAIRGVFEQLMQGVKDVRLEQVEVRASGDLAYELGRCDIVGRDDSRSQARYMIAWRKTPAGWRVEVDFFAFGDLL